MRPEVRIVKVVAIEKLLFASWLRQCSCVNIIYTELECLTAGGNSPFRRQAAYTVNEWFIALAMKFP